MTAGALLKPSTMQDIFDQFRKLFPLSKVIVNDTDMRYRFRNLVTAQYFESLAQQIILANGLPVTAELEVWKKNGVVFEMQIVVEMVPEEYLVVK